MKKFVQRILKHILISMPAKKICLACFAAFLLMAAAFPGAFFSETVRTCASEDTNPSVEGMDLSDDRNASASVETDDLDMDQSVSDPYLFRQQNISARAGEKIQLVLYTSDLYGNHSPASDVTIQVLDSDKCSTGKKIKTDSKGNAILTFENTGTYYAEALRDEKIAEPELCRITVKKAAVAFVNKKQTLKIRTGTDKGLSKTLKVTVNGKQVDAAKLKWRVGSKKIASVKNGVVTAKKEGTTTIYASIYDTTAKCSITVLDKRKLVVIDPGHQAHQDTSLEPLGPGSNEWKMKVSSGTAGRYSGSEYQLNLTVSKKLKKELLKKNYRILMTRTTNDVNLSNKERAEIANEAGADAFIRIHANSSTSSSTSGIMTICPTKASPYCKDIYKKSRKLSDNILTQMKQASGTMQGRVWETDTMTGINWCRIPVTIVELGFQSNPVEDRKLASDAYQDKLVRGIAAGLDAYFQIQP